MVGLLTSPRGRQPQAFTLVEVVAATIVVGILALTAYAYAISSAKQSSSSPAHLAVAQVVASAQVFAAGYGQFTPDPSQLSNIGRGMTVIAAPSTGPTVVSMAVSDADTLAVAVLAADNTCVATVVDSLATGGHTTSSTSAGLCSAASFLPPTETALPAVAVS